MAKASPRIRFLALVTGSLGLLVPNLASAQMSPDVSATSVALEIAPAPLAVPPAAAPTPLPPTAAAPADPLNAQVGTRVTFRVQNPNANSRDKLNDVGSDGEADVVLWGQVHPFLKWQAGFLGSYGIGSPNSHADVLDLVAKVEIAEAFNVWIGRMPMPSDRSSLSTVWALPTWTFPGIYSAYPPAAATGARPWPGPRYGTYGRGDGVTFWGQVGGGRIKYYAGVFNLDQPATSPLYTTRVNLSLINPEPGYRSSSGYYGGKNLLAIGVGAQHQAGGSLSALNSTLLPSNFNELNTDLLFEMNGGTAGVVDVEGGFAKMWGDSELASYQVLALASYLVPIDVGVGRFQPLLRYQHAGAGKAADASAFTSLDAQLGYIVDGYHARLLAIYQYAKLQGHTENAILFGLQLLSHAK
jgi:hypothetical protein